MNKLWNKVLSIILVLALLLGTYLNFGTTNVQAATSNPPNYAYANADSHYEYKFSENQRELYFRQDTYDSVKATFPLKSGQPYPRTIVVKGTTLTLNYNIWRQKNLYVYGSPLSIPSGQNYFKCGYQIQNLNAVQPYKYYTNGYFTFPSGQVCRGIEQNADDDPPHPSTCATRGEWKYLGYDVIGNFFSNMWMINTVPATSFKSKKWQADPWGLPLAPYTKLNRASEYNLTAYGVGTVKKPVVIQGVKNWIYDTFTKMSNFSGIPNNTSTPDPNVYKYLYVQSAPTLKMGGSGKMWYKRAESTYYYQTFSIPKLAKKIETPVTATISGTTVAEIPYSTDLDTKSADVNLKVSATLEDTAIQSDSSSKTVYYTRSDIYEWNFKVEIPSLGYSGGNAITFKATPQSKSKNITYATKKVATTIGKIRGAGKATSGAYKGKYVMKAYVTATPTYIDTKSGSTGNNNGDIVSGEIPPIPTPTPDPSPDPNNPEPQPVPVVDIPTLNMNNHIGEIAFDGVAFDDAADITDKSAVASEEVTINGEQVDPDTFFSKAYVFPATTDMNGYFAEVICTYDLDESQITMEGLSDEAKDLIMQGIPLQYITTDWVYVYPTKPNACYKLSSNTWKQNRIINVTNNSTEGNIQLVVNKFPIVEYRWSYGGDTSKLHKGTDTDLQKQLQYSELGAYTLTLECKNTLGKWSDPYTVEYEVLEDYAPNIEVNLNESVITRTDDLSAWHYDVNSTDGDRVAASTIELWYDSNNDGVTDTKVGTWNGLGDNGICEITDFPTFTATQLGHYKYKIFAKDEFIGVSGQDTLSQFVTDADKKSNNYEVEFWVDNYQPLSDLYIDVAIDRTSVDLFIMGDQGLPQEKLSYLADNRVNMENTLLGRNILPSINLWNMKTYEYSTPASTSSNTGQSYPPDSVPYSSAGYSGTLYRYSAPDNGNYHDFGHTEYKTESKSISSSVSGRVTCTHTYNGTSWSSSYSGTANNNYPQSYGPDGEGYSGTISQSGSGYQTGSGGGSAPSKPKSGDSYTTWTDWRVDGSGTASRTVSYWVPNMQWVANYTGYYSGTIYKYVRQPYTNPWRAASSKYILYLSDNTISEIADFNSSVAKADAKIILAGTSGIQAQSATCAKYIDVTGKTTEDVMKEALDFISAETPSIEQVYVLPNQTFTLNYGEDDLENDTIILREMQYVHHKDYFDNQTGQEPSTQTVFSDTSGWNSLNRSSFGNVGKYQLFRRVKDKPTGAYGDDYSYFSGATEVDIYVHRKPIALASLDWDFDSGTSTYKTKWIDRSYDLDHNISRSETDKGVAERKIMWRRNGDDWNYNIPDNLSPGTYNLRYYVKDIENTWSDVFTMNIDGELHSNVTEVTFTLAASPPMQFEAKLRSEELKFRTPETPVTLPASENIELYELWTRYPSNPILTMALYNVSGTQVSTTKTVNFTSNITGKKISNDIKWNNILYNTSKTLIDGNYIFKITANSEQSKTISFPITLSTPINLNGYINGKANNAQANTGDVNIFTFTTSSYVNSTQLIFEGNTYFSDLNQIKLISDDGIYKTWTYSMDIAEGAYPNDKLGTAAFKATLPSDRSEIIYVNYKIVGIRAAGFIITMMLDIGWRAYYFDVDRGIDDNHDGINDRYPRHPNTDIGTLKLPVNYFSLVGHTRNYIKAGYKVKGKIDIQGEPDSAYFKISYDMAGSTHIDNVPLTKSTGNTYMFEWIIPLDTDNKTFVSFDLVTKKGDSTYGNEKWVDKWDSRNLDNKVFYIKGNALEDLTFVQSH